jgi:hypothetical protein
MLILLSGPFGCHWLSFGTILHNILPWAILGITPFYVLYGHEPQHLGIEAPSSRDSSDLNIWLQDIDLI